MYRVSSHIKALASTNVWIALKILIGIFSVSSLAYFLKSPLIIGPLAASCGLVFTAPSAVASRFKNLFLGHTISALLGIIMLHTVGTPILAISLAGALAVLMMEVTNNVHPPACATAVIAVVGNTTMSFLVNIILGSILLIMITLFLNRTKR